MFLAKKYRKYCSDRAQKLISSSLYGNEPIEKKPEVNRMLLARVIAVTNLLVDRKCFLDFSRQRKLEI